MSAASRDDVDVVPAGPADGLVHVRDGLAEDDRLRMNGVEACADEQSRVRVGGVGAGDDRSVERPRELP